MVPFAKYRHSLIAGWFGLVEPPSVVELESSAQRLNSPALVAEQSQPATAVQFATCGVNNTEAVATPKARNTDMSRCMAAD